MWLCFVLISAVAPPQSYLPLTNSEPLTADQEARTFALPEGFRIELVAKEPNVIDPVALAFDEQGRLYVAEMFGYPNGGRGTGRITSGRIRCLEDRDGDGFYEHSTVYAEGLRFPTGVMPWRAGLLVANAPDLLYFPRQGAKPRVLYTGFDVQNIQQLLNSFVLGPDGLVYANAGGAGGTITYPEKPDFPPLTLRGRGIRFDPDRPGSLEATSGGGQYGLTCDPFGRWFTATNSQHLRHIILPDEEVRLNPLVAVRATTWDIPEHGAACRVFRRSPFEAWRLERTSRRAGGADAKRFPASELVAGGYVTSACSPLVIDTPAFPDAYQGSVLVCDPANNLLLRDTLHPHGATFIARRGHADCEFLTSTDHWFRPVALAHGPDGAIYLADFYREVIETPLSLPDDIKRRVHLQSRARGRIWRITTADGVKQSKLPSFDTEALPRLLDDANAWTRMTAFRLLLHQGTLSPQLREAIQGVGMRGTPAGRVLAMTLLRSPLENGRHPVAGVREAALRWSHDATLPIALSEDRDPRVRFQAALCLGRFHGDAATRALALLAQRPDNDSWTQTAILLAARQERASALLTSLPASSTMRGRLAQMVGQRAVEAELKQVFQALDEHSGEVLAGLGAGLRLSGGSLERLLQQPFAEPARRLFAQAQETAGDPKAPLEARQRAMGLLSYGNWEALAKVAQELLSPRTPPSLQREVIRALAGRDQPAVAVLLLQAWPSAGPELRRELSEALFARLERREALLDAIQAKQVLPSQLEPHRLAVLRQTPRGAKLLAGTVSPKRDQVVRDYAEALKLPGNSTRGKLLFAKHCAACHRLEGVGHQVGADLLSALRGKSAEQLLVDILDPSREVDPRFLNYQVRTTRGVTYTGVIVADTATTLTLRRGESAEDIIPRRQIESIESSGVSLMPEGFEQHLDKQQMADLIRYLQSIR